MNDTPTLRERAEDYVLTRWAVCKWYDQWSACDPSVTDSMADNDPEFDTFAEAIEYAQKQARA